MSSVRVYTDLKSPRSDDTTSPGKRRSVYLIILCFLLLMLAAATPQVHWPFLVPNVTKKGASSLACSLVTSSSSFSVFFTSLLSNKIINCFPNTGLLNICCAVLNSLSTALHGLILMFNNLNLMIAFSMLVRALQGVSCTILQVVTSAVLINKFPLKTGRVSALNETAIGLGCCFGPLLGGLLFDKVGFLLTFLLFGTVGIFLIPPLYFLSYTKIKPATRPDAYSRSLLKDPLFLSPLLSFTLCIAVETALDFTLALYVEEAFQEDASFAGYLLGSMPISSVLLAFPIGYLCDKTNPFLIGLCGCVLTFLGYLAMVPPPYLTLLPCTKISLAVCIFVAGLGSSMIYLHLMPAMVYVKSEYRGCIMSEELSKVVSLMYVLGFSVGEITGSFLAGILKMYCGYWQYFAVLSAVMLFAIFSNLGLYLYCCCCMKTCHEEGQSNDDSHTNNINSEDKGTDSSDYIGNLSDSQTNNIKFNSESKGTESTSSDIVVSKKCGENSANTGYKEITTNDNNDNGVTVNNTFSSDNEDDYI